MLKGLWTAAELHEREVLHVHLDPLAWDGHGVALGLLAGSGAMLLHQASPLEHPVGAKDTDVVAFLGQVVGQATWPISGAPSQGQEPVCCSLWNSPGVSVGPAGAVLEHVEVPLPLLVAVPPLVEGLAADAVVLAHSGHGDTSLVHLDPGQPLLENIPGATLQVGDLLSGRCGL